MTGCPQSSIEISAKCKNKNGRQTKPHPPSTLISEDSLRTVECNADLQFTLIKRNSQEIVYNIYTVVIHWDTRDACMVKSSPQLMSSSV